jgi:hypothetical protein
VSYKEKIILQKEDKWEDKLLKSKDRGSREKVKKFIAFVVGIER